MLHCNVTNLSVESVPEQLHDILPFCPWICEALHPLYKRSMVDGCLLCGEREAEPQNHLPSARPEPAHSEEVNNESLCMVLLDAYCTQRTTPSNISRRGLFHGLPVHFLCKCQQLVDDVVEKLLCTGRDPSMSSGSEMVSCGTNFQRTMSQFHRAPAGQCRISSGMGFSSYSTTSWIGDIQFQTIACTHLHMIYAARGCNPPC